MSQRLTLTALLCATSCSFAAMSARAEGTYDLSIGGISDDFLGRTEQYGIVPFDGIYISGQNSFGNLDYDFTLGQPFENDATDSALIFYDLSYGFLDNNWRVGVGQKERHWSPSEYTSLVLSRNAPAFPSVYIAKENATSTDLPVLRWIGPWNGEVFVGTTDDVNQPNDALILGTRLGLEPNENLEIEFVRTVQFGGAGQSADFGTLIDSLVGSTNESDSASAIQLAGIGASYHFGPEAFKSRIYAQTVGEDEAGSVPSCFFYLAGIESQMHLFGTPSTISLEHVDTSVDFIRNGDCVPNTAYNNNTYSYRNEGVVLGASIGSESRSTALRGRHELEAWAFDWSIGDYTINDAANPNHSLSTSRETGTSLTVGASTDFLSGTLQGIAAYQDFDLDTAEQDNGLRFGMNFIQSF